MVWTKYRPLDVLQLKEVEKPVPGFLEIKPPTPDFILSTSIALRTGLRFLS